MQVDLASLVRVASEAVDASGVFPLVIYSQVSKQNQNRQALKGFAGAPAAVMRADARGPHSPGPGPCTCSCAVMRRSARAPVCHAPHW